MKRERIEERVGNPPLAAVTEANGSEIDTPPDYRPAHAPVAPPGNDIDDRPQDPLPIRDGATKLDGGIVAASVKEAHAAADFAFFLIGEIEQVRETRPAHRQPFAFFAAMSGHGSSDGRRLRVGVHGQPQVGFDAAHFAPFTGTCQI